MMLTLFWLTYGYSSLQIIILEVNSNVNWKLHCKLHVLLHLLCSGWVTAINGEHYPLTSDQTVEIKTTEHQVGRHISVYFDPSTSFIFQNDGTRWFCVIRGCMLDSWGTPNSLNGVPNDNTRVWKITKTAAALIMVCNGVTVLNFKFSSDYLDGYSNCHNDWTGQSTSIYFSWSFDSLFILKGKHLILSSSLKLTVMHCSKFSDHILDFSW